MAKCVLNNKVGMIKTANCCANCCNSSGTICKLWEIAINPGTICNAYENDPKRSARKLKSSENSNKAWSLSYFMHNKKLESIEFVLGSGINSIPNAFLKKLKDNFNFEITPSSFIKYNSYKTEIDGKIISNECGWEIYYKIQKMLVPLAYEVIEKELKSMDIEKLKEMEEEI